MLTKTIRDVMGNVMKKPLFTNIHFGRNKPKYVQDQKLVVLLDVSGSTNNNHRRCGIRNLSSDFINIDNVPVTPPIIIAECEAIALFLMENLLVYDMTDSIFHLIVFSTSFVHKQFKIYSNEHFYETVIMELDNLFNYEMDETNLLEPVKFIFNNIISENNNIHTQILLATDGQPYDKDEVVKFLNCQKSQYSIFIIGAGSIQQSIGENQTRSCANGINNPRDYLNDPKYKNLLELHSNMLNLSLLQLTEPEILKKIKSIQEIIKPVQKVTTPINRKNINTSECDKEYLESIAYISTAKFGYYCGAFGDYSVLKNSIKEWLIAHSAHNIQKSTYKVVLDNGTFGSLTNETNRALQNNNVVIVKSEFGHHLITTKWQLAISSKKNIPDFFIIEMPDQLKILGFDEMKSQPLNKIQIDYFSINPLLTSKGWYKIRRIVKI